MQGLHICQDANVQVLHFCIDINMQILHTLCREVCKMTELKELRVEKQMTQKEAAERLGISLRSYVTYENDESKVGSSKYRFLMRELSEIDRKDEDNGILSVEEITGKCREVFSAYPVDFCYLFGSYAKGTAGESSDVDLLIATDVSGLVFYEIAEKLRQMLHKRIDLLDIKQLLNNEELLREVLKTGERIYG